MPPDLAADYWEGTMRAAPRWATQLGDHRFDDKLEDLTPAAKAGETARLGKLLEAIGRAAPRDDGERLTLAALRIQVESDLDSLSCASEEWTVDPLEGPQVDLLDMVEYQEADTPEQAKAMVARWRAIGPYLDAFMANLRRGLAVRRVATRDAAAKVLVQLGDLLARPIRDWPLLSPLQVAHEDWPPGELHRFRQELEAAVTSVVKPRFERYHALLRDEILPNAREAVGLSALEGGLEDYRKLIRVYTSLDLSPEEIQRTGLAQVARVKGELEALGRKLFSASDLAAVRARIDGDGTLFFATREQVKAKAEATLARAQAAAPAFFGKLPKTPCVVKAVEPHEEKFSTVAYYRPPAGDGTSPGTYMINTYRPETRPRYEAQALAFHEAVPGHHLQIALAQELPGLAEFRKHAGVTAYVEGWGLYSERLADEMGLYDGDVDRLGMLSYDAWRCCRLVVDTGMHALGWTRQRAIDFMIANTLLQKEDAENEVDRYIVWPGQALAYKLGQLEIEKLRAEAKEAKGAAFDLREFHDRVLEVGPVSLALLRERIAAWLATRAPGA